MGTRLNSDFCLLSQLNSYTVIVRECQGVGDKSQNLSGSQSDSCLLSPVS